LRFPLITPLVNPDAVGPFIIPCQQESVTEYTSSFLILTADRVKVEKGDLKGRLQEVHMFPKGDN
jgi:hypothetical protein